MIPNGRRIAYVRTRVGISAWKPDCSDTKQVPVRIQPDARILHHVTSLSAGVALVAMRAIGMPSSNYQSSFSEPYSLSLDSVKFLATMYLDCCEDATTGLSLSCLRGSSSAG